MAANFGLSLVFIAIMVASMQFHGTMAQTTHIVGDASGWTILNGGAAAYTTWASQQTFTVGDALIFNFTNRQHDVAEVSAAAYDPCTSTNPISLATTSPATLALTTPGTHYYICTFTSHCQIGQKLTINVSASATATSPPLTTPTTPASPPTTTPPSLTPTTPTELPCPPTSSPTSSPLSPPTFTTGNTTPTPNSAAPSFTAVVPAALMAIGLAFLNF
ncbi:putative Phytocyanin domain, cupredoxin [Helianthus annuus]|uniref:Phytocyanin domain, cupredoxin n=1 Tax=Helianthus annuus TaxID=4232 RepID=A0A251TRI6_HELAN|nr:cucumber peeling cupredoxin [Helianthus annuus]KAF5789163.1 putative Phytocyanin domain, cupredoxin [Helianthus annuus]KAJ0540903.1 putative Phytocyanin domain, cupredoxin [Helianthus annuus]KAJ0706002.1 putative Phytocyanin domain, cupredoxin [Helianthus annuus]KAJ0886405.1 putative Phytocyanin domain, cupredoxin [Helianthus annuus]